MTAVVVPRPRPRPLPPVVRLLLFVAIALVATLVALVLLGSAPQRVAAGSVASGNAVRAAVGAIAELAGALCATWVMLRIVERRPWDFVSLGRTARRWPSLAGGAAVGSVAIGTPSLAFFTWGWLRPMPGDATSWPVAIALLIAVLAPAALAEEVLFRGYPFAVVRERWGTGAAVAGTSFCFGLVHLANAHVAAEPIALVIAAGAFLAAVLVVSNSLYAAWAAHFAWNFTLAGVVHAAVSGEILPTPLYRLADSGPAWVTGGAWGPEGGAGAAVGMAMATGLLYAPRLARRWGGGGSPRTSGDRELDP